MIRIHRDPLGTPQPWRTLRKLGATLQVVLGHPKERYPQVVKQFEEDFAQFIGCRYSASFCNGTSALDAALFGIGVSAGDKVLVPAVTFHATVSPLLAARAEPIFVDVDQETGNIDLADLKRKASLAKTLVVTHNWGNPIDMDRLQDIITTNEMTLIEDCSLSHGACWRGRRLGSFGAAGVFSLQAQKAISAGEGGICVTNERKVWERLLLFGHFGRLPVEARLPENQRFPSWGWGQKRRAHPIGLALAAVDLDYLESDNVKRRTTVRELQSWMNSVRPDYRLLIPDEEGHYGGAMSAAILCRLGPVHTLVKQLRSVGIPASRCHYAPMHLEPIFGDPALQRELLSGKSGGEQPESVATEDCPAARTFGSKVFFLPLDRSLLRAQKDTLLRVLREYLLTLCEERVHQAE